MDGADRDGNDDGETEVGGGGGGGQIFSCRMGDNSMADVVKSDSAFTPVADVRCLFAEPLQRSLLSEDLRANLFFLFSSWCAHFGIKAPGLERYTRQTT